MSALLESPDSGSGEDTVVTNVTNISNIKVNNYKISTFLNYSRVVKILK